MILNPDGVGFVTFCASLISAGLFTIFLVNKGKEIWSIPALLAVFAIAMFLGERVESHFQANLAELTQPALVKYKRAEPTKYGNKYYLTLVFNNGCTSDLLVTYNSYREAVEGKEMMITPTFQLYKEALEHSCKK